MGTVDAANISLGAQPLKGLRTRLSVMMFLEFFIWGAWLPLIFGYLPRAGFTTLEQALILNAFALASFTAMFFSTQFADRNFSAERFMAFSQVVGGVAILALFFLHAPAGTTPGTFNAAVLEARGDSATQGISHLADGTRVVINGLPEDFNWDKFAQMEKDKRPEFFFLITATRTEDGQTVLVGDVNAPRAPFWPVFLCMLVHSLFYVPTISISNSIAFTHLKDAQREFGLVRLWGTIGWIAASWPFVFILTSKGAALQQATASIFLVAGIASLVLGGFSLALPHTPPRPAAPGGEKFAWLEATKLLRVPFLLVLFVVTFIDAMVHQGYFIFSGDYLKEIGIEPNLIMPIMSIGQVAEIGTMAVLGYFLKRLGWRWTMVIGVLGHTARFTVFAFCQDFPLVVVLVNVLHGICYAFFFATVYIFVDEFFPKDARNSAQGLFNFLILGAGPFVANFLWPFLRDKAFTVDGLVDYRTMFLVPAGIGLFAAMLLLVFFHPPAKATVPPVHGLGDVPGPVEEGIMAAKGHPSS